MAIPARLEADIQSLRNEGHAIGVVEDGSRYFITFERYSLPAYDPEFSDLMVMTDYQYPQSKMDMFWTAPAVHKKDGAYPQSADNFEDHAGRHWQRWSWHYPTWDPSRHNLRTHLEVINDRLAKGT